MRYLLNGVAALKTPRNDAFSGEIASSGTPSAIGGLSRNDVFGLAMI